MRRYIYTVSTKALVFAEQYNVSTNYNCKTDYLNKVRAGRQSPRARATAKCVHAEADAAHGLTQGHSAEDVLSPPLASYVICRSSELGRQHRGRLYAVVGACN